MSSINNSFILNGMNVNFATSNSKLKWSKQVVIIHFCKNNGCLWYIVKQLDEHSKIVKVEFFFDRGELLGGLLKGATSDVSKTEMPSTSSCPFLKNTG